MNEFETFFATIRKQGEVGREITVDKKVGDFMGLEDGDTVKVMIKKIVLKLWSRKLLKKNKKGRWLWIFKKRVLVKTYVRTYTTTYYIMVYIIYILYISISILYYILYSIFI